MKKRKRENRKAKRKKPLTGKAKADALLSLYGIWKGLKMPRFKREKEDRF